MRLTSTQLFQEQRGETTDYEVHSCVKAILKHTCNAKQKAECKMPYTKSQQSASLYTVKVFAEDIVCGSSSAGCFWPDEPQCVHL